LVADSHSILVRWRDHFSQLLNIQRENVVKQRDIHTAEPLVPELSAFDVAMGIGNLKRHKSPGIDYISAELIKTGGRRIRSEIHKLIKSIWHKEELLEECKKSFNVPIYKKGGKTDLAIIAYTTITFVNYVQNFIRHPAVKFNSICRRNYWKSSIWIWAQQTSDKYLREKMGIP